MDAAVSRVSFSEVNIPLTYMSEVLKGSKRGYGNLGARHLLTPGSSSAHVIGVSDIFSLTEYISRRKSCPSWHARLSERPNISILVA